MAHFLVLTQQKSADSTTAEKTAPVPSSAEAVPAETSSEPAQPSDAGESFTPDQIDGMLLTREVP